MPNIVGDIVNKISEAIDKRKESKDKNQEQQISPQTDASSSFYPSTVDHHHHHHHHHTQQLNRQTASSDTTEVEPPATSTGDQYLEDDAIPRITNAAPINASLISGGYGRLLLTENIKYSPTELQPPSNIKTVDIDDAIQQRNKRNDAGYIPWHTRPRLQATTRIKVYHMYNKSLPAIDVDIPNDYFQFQLSPSYLYPPTIPPHERIRFSEEHPDTELPKPQPFVYYNASDPEFYKQTLPNPRMTIWLLIKNTTFVTGGYVKRRLVEECYRQNIQVWLMNPNRFDLSLGNSFTADNVDRLENILINPRTGRKQLIYGNTAVDVPDAVIPRVGANVDYFGLAVMRQLEAMGVKVFNPSQSVEISRDKLFTHQVLASSAIPRSLLSRIPFDLKLIGSHFGYPVIMKAPSGSRGDAVWKLDSKEELHELIKSNTLDVSKPLIFQEFLAATRGRDLRCFVVGNTLVAAMMRIAASGFKANVHQGGSVQVVYPAEKLTLLSIQTAKMCQLDFSGVDLLLDKNSYRICEVNSSPGFEGLEKATEVDIAKHVIDYAVEYVQSQQKQAGDVVAQPLQQEALLVPVDPAHLN